MYRFSMISLLICLIPVSSFADDADSIFGDWALTLPTKEAGWLSVSLNDGNPHVELMWAVGGVRSLPIKKLDADRVFLEFKNRGKTDELMFHSQSNLLNAALITRENESTMTKKFSGKRMPPIPSKPDLSRVTFGPKNRLFNGTDLTGWKVTDNQKINGWSVKDGVLTNDTPKKDFSAYGDHANLRTVEEFDDFRLHIEFRPPTGGNSGVYLRGMYEVQVVDRDSKMQGLQGVGSIFGRVKATKNAGKPGGEWNTYDITLVDRHVTVVLNGETVIDNQPVPGPTGGALLSDVTKPGPIFLQGDHTSIAYRNIWIEPVIE